MAEIIPVSEPDDPRLADYLRLRDVQLRRSLETTHGLFIAEGDKVIRRAVAAGHPVRSFLLTERWRAQLDDVLDQVAAPAYLVTPQVAAHVAGFPVHRGALASLARLPLPPVGDLLATARRLVVLEDIVDHTNVGAIFRSVAAFGVDAVVLAPRCADPLYRRAIKVSMGAVFAVPYARLTDWRGGLALLRRAGFRLLALTPAADAHPIDQAVAEFAGRRCALLLGAEGDGLSARWLREADRQVRIPMSAVARDRGVDSLNVAAAAAVACYAFMRPDSR